VPRIHPFDAIRPAPGVEARIASPPYDVVTTDEARTIAAGNPLCFLNVVRSEITLPASTDPYAPAVYARARENFDRLRHDGAMLRDGHRRMYLYRQTWRGRSQTGLVCCCHVDDYAADRIKKHEKTRRVKEDDRTRHVLALNANAGPVFLAHRDVPDLVPLRSRDMNARPLYHFTAVDEVTHTIWPVDDWQPYRAIFARLDSVYVADGHHRAASAYRAGLERRADNPGHTGEEEYNWFLVCLFPASELTILSYNRLVRDLHGLSASRFIDRLRAVGRVTPDPAEQVDRTGSFRVYVGGEWHRVEFDPASIDRRDVIRSLDVSLLQDRVLHPILGIGDPRTDERIDFVGGIRGDDFLKKQVDSGAAAAAFALHATTMEQLMAVADAGMVMPPKSTWFEPKLRSGLLVHTLDEG